MRISRAEHVILVMPGLCPMIHVVSGESGISREQGGASLMTVIDAAQTKTGMTGTEEPLGKFSFDGQSLPIQVKASTRAILRTAPNTTRYDIADTLFYEAYRMHLKM